ncbi:ABC transporter permease [Shouchella lehensis]|uniref:Bacterial ABC transporter EcsB n=1 Tax=Shouchella lehensis G1 TaxID=1246626 RepID=A0A060LUU1_9BACI|nr:ABC transporter permease [Shouchella lehensis]AIC93932.1 bacterial ABC transporter EcsB [Shouchella lehensis G1]
MRQAQELWESRRHQYWSEARGYLKLILNSGFVISVYFLFIFLTVYYQQFVEQMPVDFPLVPLLTVLFTWRLTAGSIRTFVKPADVVFLLPYETKMSVYFNQALRYSSMWQASYIVLLFMACGPMFTERIGTGATFWLALLFLLLIKIWNLLCVWQEQRLVAKGERYSNMALRMLINAVAAYLLFAQAPVWLIVAIVVLMAILYKGYWQPLEKKHSLKWERLIEVENQMVMFFYRIANAFTDVPQLRNKVRERTYLQWAVQLLGGKKDAVYHYLYARTFIRANDYLGTYLRLTIVGGLFIYVLPLGWMKLAMALLFTHITMMQLSTLSFHHSASIWIDLYPIKPEEKKQALTYITARLLFLLAIVYGVVAVVTSDLLYGVLILVASALLGLYGSQTLVHRKKGKYRRVR